MLDLHAMTAARRTLKSDKRVQIPLTFIDEAMIASVAFTGAMSADGVDFRVRIHVDPLAFLEGDAVAWFTDSGAEIVVSAIPASVVCSDANSRLAAVFAAAAEAYAEAWRETPEGRAWKGDDCAVSLAKGVLNLPKDTLALARSRICN